MKSIVILLATFFTFTIVAFTQESRMAIPPHAELSAYPIQSGLLSIGKQADLGLHPVRLKADWAGFNYYQRLRGGRWVYEVVPAGTIVLADSTGTPVYKASCGNRLVAMPPASAATPCGHWPQWFYNLLSALFLLALLALLIWLFYLLFSSSAERRTHHEDGGAHPEGSDPQGGTQGGPQPTPPGAGPTGNRPPQQPTPDPTPTARFFAVYLDGESVKVNFGGFRRITFHVTERGEYSVNAS